MKPKPATSGSGRYDSTGTRREQELCMDALLSGEFDGMSDQEWVALCEQIAHAEQEAAEAAEAAKLAGSGASQPVPGQ